MENRPYNSILMVQSVTPRTSLAASAREYIRELWHRREFALYMALGNLQARNASTSLGLFWWVLNPLLLGAIYGLIFGVVLKVSRGIDDYVAYLLAGMFVFYYTRSSMVGAVNSILTNAKMLANLRFPRMVLPVSALVESAVGFASSLSVYYFIVGPINGIWPTAALVWLIPAFVIHSAFNLGMAAFVARIAVPFRDVNNLVPYMLRLWLYLSPIIYPVAQLETVNAGLRNVLKLNPLFPILSMYRHALVGTDMPLSDVLYAVLWSVVILVVGVGVFVRSEARMTRYL